MGIILANVKNVQILGNIITNTTLGISISNVIDALILNNDIVSNHYDLDGIFLESTDGQVRNNTISGHSNGIHLGNSSPDIGGNTITDNLNHGIYIGIGSLPNMEGVLSGSPPLYFPISGYNNIYENGGWSGTEDNDGSEIFIYNANAILRSGCNSIIDSRMPDGEFLINTQALMNSYGDGLPIQVHAENNYWGEHEEYDLSERFGSLIVYYEPYLSSPCTIPTGGSGRELLISSSSGNVIDTLYSLPIEVGELAETDILYASAEEKYLAADFNGAKAIYDQIANSNESLDTKLKAYQMLYNIGNLTGKEPEYFAGLYSTYSTLSESTEDSLLQKVFSQLASLSLVSQKEYISAINEFDEVIQQNQQSEEAIYAEIDAITTALMLPQDSSLNKGTLGKYIVSDYSARISHLLKNGRGKNTESANNLPTQYYLEQNYPNPFNPATKIKYSVPKSGNVKLVVYDILGREVRILTDEVKEPGYYEVNFNASHLSSGVYFYRIVAGNYVNTKKMLLLK
jgi:parallel beta-helix repeat protein